MTLGPLTWLETLGFAAQASMTQALSSAELLPLQHTSPHIITLSASQARVSERRSLSSTDDSRTQQVMSNAPMAQRHSRSQDDSIGMSAGYDAKIDALQVRRNQTTDVSFKIEHLARP